jgi:UDP-N-acetylglucosamine diphosphorylase/glucosamine-1-phosphate N-acetyltransferase
MKDNIAVVILAAGLGTRMKSGRAKVLHEIHGAPMIFYVLEAATRIPCNDIVVVVGNQADTVKMVVSDRYKVCFALQEKQLGTGHAVQCAIPYIPEHVEEVLILCGDVPLVRSKTLKWLVEGHVDAGRDVTVLSVEMDDPNGYGRVVRNDKGRVCGIVEQVDATEEQKKIRDVNTGIYCVKKSFLLEALNLLDTDNQQSELYLTDIIRIGYERSREIGSMASSTIEEFLGVNTQEDLRRVSSIISRQGKSS